MTRITSARTRSQGLDFVPDSSSTERTSPVQLPIGSIDGTKSSLRRITKSQAKRSKSVRRIRNLQASRNSAPPSALTKEPNDTSTSLKSVQSDLDNFDEYGEEFLPVGPTLLENQFTANRTISSENPSLTNSEKISNVGSDTSPDVDLHADFMDIIHNSMGLYADSCAIFKIIRSFMPGDSNFESFYARVCRPLSKVKNRIAHLTNMLTQRAQILSPNRLLIDTALATIVLESFSGSNNFPRDILRFLNDVLVKANLAIFTGSLIQVNPESSQVLQFLRQMDAELPKCFIQLHTCEKASAGVQSLFEFALLLRIQLCVQTLLSDQSRTCHGDIIKLIFCEHPDKSDVTDTLSAGLPLLKGWDYECFHRDEWNNEQNSILLDHFKEFTKLSTLQNDFVDLSSLQFKYSWQRFVEYALKFSRDEDAAINKYFALNGGFEKLHYRTSNLLQEVDVASQPVLTDSTEAEVSSSAFSDADCASIEKDDKTFTRIDREGLHESFLSEVNSHEYDVNYHTEDEQFEQFGRAVVENLTGMNERSNDKDETGLNGMVSRHEGSCILSSEGWEECGRRSQSLSQSQVGSQTQSQGQTGSQTQSQGQTGSQTQSQGQTGSQTQSQGQTGSQIPSQNRTKRPNQATRNRFVDRQSTATRINFTPPAAEVDSSGGRRGEICGGGGDLERDAKDGKIVEDNATENLEDVINTHEDSFSSSSHNAEVNLPSDSPDDHDSITSHTDKLNFLNQPCGEAEELLADLSAATQFAEQTRLVREFGSFVNDGGSIGERRKRMGRRQWSMQEHQALIEHMRQRPCQWAEIKRKDEAGLNIFKGRSQVDLKDKARNMRMLMEKSGQVLPGFELVTLKKTQKEQIEKFRERREAEAALAHESISRKRAMRDNSS